MTHGNTGDSRINILILSHEIVVELGPNLPIRVVFISYLIFKYIVLVKFVAHVDVGNSGSNGLTLRHQTSPYSYSGCPGPRVLVIGDS